MYSFTIQRWNVNPELIHILMLVIKLNIEFHFQILNSLLRSDVTQTVVLTGKQFKPIPCILP